VTVKTEKTELSARCSISVLVACFAADPRLQGTWAVTPQVKARVRVHRCDHELPGIELRLSPSLHLPDTMAALGCKTLPLSCHGQAPRALARVSVAPFRSAPVCGRRARAVVVRAAEGRWTTHTVPGTSGVQAAGIRQLTAAARACVVSCSNWQSYASGWCLQPWRPCCYTANHHCAAVHLWLDNMHHTIAAAWMHTSRYILVCVLATASAELNHTCCRMTPIGRWTSPPTPTHTACSHTSPCHCVFLQMMTWMPAWQCCARSLVPAGTAPRQQSARAAAAPPTAAAAVRAVAAAAAVQVRRTDRGGSMLASLCHTPAAHLVACFHACPVQLPQQHHCKCTGWGGAHCSAALANQ
jgi:hypothetical protein